MAVTMLLVIRSTLIMAVFVAVVSAAGSARCAPSDPFDQTTQVVSGPLLEKWLATNKQLARDHALLSACNGSEVLGCETALRLRHIIEDAKAQQGLAVIGHINRAINLEIKAVPQSDWLSPLEAISGAGDCKAYSIAKYFALREAGIAPDHLRLIAVHLDHGGRSEDHMVVATLWQDQWLILDNLTLALVPDVLSDYVPLLVFDDGGMRRYTTDHDVFAIGATRHRGLR
ncbi:MAG: transglutaminase-like cysteine peptidase [Xanthobacteraceae bacterium]|jgi:predicted transglutaminase-like cysteine proteinase